MRTLIETAYIKCDAFNRSKDAFLAEFENDAKAQQLCKIKHTDDIHVYAFYCPNCGHEYYTYWREQYYYCLYSEHLGSLTRYRSYGQPQLPEQVSYDKITEHYAKKYRGVFFKGGHTPLGDKFRKEYKGFCDTEKANCPLCGTKWQNSPGMFFKSGFNFAGMWHSGTFVGGDHSDAAVDACIDSFFAIMAKERKKANEERSQTKVLSLMDSDIATSLMGNPVEVTDKQFLRQHIAAILTLETNLVSLKNWLTDLYTQQVDTDFAVKEKSYFLLKEPKEKLANCRQQLDALNSKDPLEDVKLSVTPKAIFEIPPAPAEPDYEKPGLFNKKKVEAANARRKLVFEQEKAAHAQAVAEIKRQEAAAEAEYEQKMIIAKESYQRQCREAADRHNAAICECKRQIEKWEQEILRAAESDALNSTQEMQVKVMVDSDIQQAEDLLRRTLDARNKLYGCNVIFGKYRDPVALAAFYEYLVSGRCQTLDGPNGAYNLYEAEIRANTIISQLSEVIKNLEQIRENQFMIYTQLDNMNKSLLQLNSTMDEAVKSLRSIQGNTGQIVENTKIIAHNTYATAYYAKKNAELTNALGFMVALK